MLVVHANWTRGALRLWGESLDAFHHAQSRSALPDSAPGGVATATTAVIAHPFAVNAQELLATLEQFGIENLATSLAADSLRLRLPRDSNGPWPSERLGRAAGTVDQPVDPWLGDVEIPCITVPPAMVPAVLMALDRGDRLGHGIELSQSVRYWAEVVRFILDLLADQRFVPMLLQESAGTLAARWFPWLHDDQARIRVAGLLAMMPPVVRAVADDEKSQQGWPILDEALRLITDSFIRQILESDSYMDAVADRDATTDGHVTWLTGLLGPEAHLTTGPHRAFELLRDAGQWIGRLDDVGQGRPFHLCLRLAEPQSDGSAVNVKNPMWSLTFHLQSADDSRILIDAASLWEHTAGGSRVNGHRIDNPQELLLAELGRAARVYPLLEDALAQRAPSELSLTTDQAYEFLREIKPVLEESGVGIIVPSWWDQPMGRLAARLQVDPLDPAADAATRDSASEGLAPPGSILGLNTLVQFRWQVAVGDQPLALEEFQALMKQNAPLVQVRGKWVEIRPDQLAAARKMLTDNPTGRMTLLQAIHLAHGGEKRPGDVPVTGLDASGWIADVLGASTDNQRMPRIDQPFGFLGSLRPYQLSGLSWLAFLDRYGLGACLADDMGLGKTIQLIALLLQEREILGVLPATSGAPIVVDRASSVGPTLLIVPTSVVANWTRELARFAPALTVYVHHGPDRAVGSAFAQEAGRHDVIITTYPLVARDSDTLKPIHWHRVALDEAQYIKNPPTKQTTAIRALHAPRRLALTGTPVENRLSELWSIMDFCNPGYLGPAGEFRRRYSMAIERRRDQLQAENLRRMVRPFILRRVKTDPKVINDLPPCVETKEYATLTAEQATMYQRVVNGMLGEIDRAEGIQRRGLVLAALVRLKQICNHPAQVNGLSDDANATGIGETPIVTAATSLDVISAASARSGKTQRLITMLEEVAATDGKALIFTQFRQMGHLLTAMIQNELDCEVLFLHGGTPATKRQHLIDRFQAPDGGVPFFVLSLKAGGLGLNLTAANHVFHFDRWWNPAVENQATDRAFRIGQTRKVHVHKFVCVGTLEERIDQMIEQKTELATNIIGSGEQWLTEFSTGQLREMLMLRQGAVEVDS